MFDLARLKLLRELAHRGTMTAVADAVGLTSSAVSQQLATLESEARMTLLERVGRRVRLTAEGQRLVNHAEAILKAVETAELDLQAAKRIPSGVLEIACFPTVAKARLLPAVLRMRRRYPQLQVRIQELESADAIGAVRDGRCHLALSFAYNLTPRSEIPGLAAHPLIDEPVLIALPEKWRRSPAQIGLKHLADEDWIVGSRQTDDRLLAERACATAGFVPRIVHSVDDYELVLKMVFAGLGVGFVPKLALSSPSARKVVARRIRNLSLSRRIEAVTRSALTDRPAVQALLSELRRDS